MRIGILASALLLAGTAPTAPALADLRDVAASSSGGTGHVWLLFDTAPEAVDAAITQTGLQLDITGVEVRQRVIAPYDVSLVSTITVTPTDTGARIDIGDGAGWNSARAEIVDGAILVTIGLPQTQMRVDGTHVQPAADAEVQPSSPAAEDTPPDASAPASRAAAGEDFDTPLPSSAPDGETVADAASGAPEAQPEAAATPEPAASAGAGSPADPCGVEAAAVASYPWDDDRLHAHAACLTEAGELNAAAEIYQQMLAFAPENFRALIALADLREAQGDDAAARELYSQAAENALSDAEASRARARLRELRNQ